MFHAFDFTNQSAGRNLAREPGPEFSDVTRKLLEINERTDDVTRTLLEINNILNQHLVPDSRD